jgi:hypothetical protein
MQISKEKVKEFIELYSKYFNVILNEKEAEAKFESLIRILKLIR